MSLFFWVFPFFLCSLYHSDDAEDILMKHVTAFDIPVGRSKRLSTLLMMIKIALFSLIIRSFFFRHEREVNNVTSVTYDDHWLVDELSWRLHLWNSEHDDRKNSKPQNLIFSRRRRMDANRAETEIESKKLHDQLTAFQVRKNFHGSVLINILLFSLTRLDGNRHNSIEGSTINWRKWIFTTWITT